MSASDLRIGQQSIWNSWRAKAKDYKTIQHLAKWQIISEQLCKYQSLAEAATQQHTDTRRQRLSQPTKEQRNLEYEGRQQTAEKGGEVTLMLDNIL